MLNDFYSSHEQKTQAIASEIMGNTRAFEKNVTTISLQTVQQNGVPITHYNVVKKKLKNRKLKDNIRRRIIRIL